MGLSERDVARSQGPAQPGHSLCCLPCRSHPPPLRRECSISRPGSHQRGHINEAPPEFSWLDAPPLLRHAPALRSLRFFCLHPCRPLRENTEDDKYYSSLPYPLFPASSEPPCAFLRCRSLYRPSLWLGPFSQSPITARRRVCAASRPTKAGPPRSRKLSSMPGLDI